MVHDTVMWEVRAVPGRLAELLAWVEAHAGPEPGGTADVYTAADDRIVVIRRGPGRAPAPLPDPPSELLARPVHQWPFAYRGGSGAPS